MSQPRTLVEKIWDRHVVVPQREDAPAVLYVDLHLIHEVTSPQAFDVLRQQGLPVRRPERTVATMDHSTPTVTQRPGALPVLAPDAARQLEQLRHNCREFGIRLHDMDSPDRGIVHVIGPELGLTQPGMTIVCGDSHTSTHGAFGALAFGIGTTEVGHVLATQCLLQRRPKTMAVQIDGELPYGVTAKDLILSVIGAIGVHGGTGHVIEYRGEAVRALSMEQRMTVCNMSIEAGARAGLIGPDEETFAYLRGRRFSPAGDDWARATSQWAALATDAGATFDRTVHIDASAMSPVVTWGTHPGMVVAAGGRIPATDGDAQAERAMAYMGLTAGSSISDYPVHRVFLGSCTNARLSDLRGAAGILRGRRVASGVRLLVVPGSQRVKREAEAEGLDQVFIEAGADWREPGCSMCLAMNADRAGSGEYVVSTSTRNCEGRQGAGARTILASPLTAAAAAVAGRVVDPRDFIATSESPCS